MTAKGVLNNALTRLGYTAANGNEQLTRRIMNKAVAIINDVYQELFNIENANTEFVPIESLDGKITLSSKAQEALIYGVCAFIAQSENDGDNQQWWITMFNKKRASLSKITTVKDTFPRSFDL